MNSYSDTLKEQAESERNKVLNVAVNVMNFMGGNWSPMENDPDHIYRRVGYCQVNGEEKRFYPEIYFSFHSGDRNRLVIGYSISRELNRRHAEGSVWNEKNEEIDRPSSITVAIDKDPIKIANDIKRKLLPEIAIYHELLIKKVKETESFHTQKDNLIMRVALATDSLERVRDDRGNVRESFYLNGVGGSRSIRISSGESIQLEGWYVTEEEFLKIYEILKQR
jgi:hypothetical protein